MKMNSTNRLACLLLSAAVAAAVVAPSTAVAATGYFTVTGGTEGTDYAYSNGTLHIKTPTPLTISTDRYVSDNIVVDAGVHAELTLDGVSISTTKCPIDITTNLYGTANGSRATSGNQIVNKTSLYLKIADGSVNTLSTTSGPSAGIHCGEGSELVIDDARDNRAADGTMAVVLGAKLAAPITLKDGTVLEEGDPSHLLDSDNPGKLTVYGGLRGAGDRKSVV